MSLLKISPLSGPHRMLKGRHETIDGWRMVVDFGDPEAEKRALAEDSVLVDWSHIGKIRLYGGRSVEEIQKVEPDAAALPIHGTRCRPGRVTIRLVEDEFLILCRPGEETGIFGRFDSQATTLTDETGTLACLVLAGPRRDEVIERSTALNLRREAVPDHTAVQTTVHGVRCTIYRTPDADLVLTGRDTAHFLFDAFLDVGTGVGLRPAGLSTLPVQLGEGS